jgi:methylated-DNA-[protein]-cysteine S-methyltransferase
MIGFAAVAAPWGPIHVATTADGVVGLEVLTTPEAFADVILRRFGETPAAAPDRPTGRRLADAAARIEAHLAGDRDALAGLPIVLHGLSDWDRRVLQGVRRIPWGEVIGYGGLARAIGRPGAARAAGAAVGRNPVGLLVPCHRVISGDGGLGGYGGSWYGGRDALLAIKRTLLRLEGNDPVVGRIRWATFGELPG